jgi:hypothetical protein
MSAAGDSDLKSMKIVIYMGLCIELFSSKGVENPVNSS